MREDKRMNRETRYAQKQRCDPREELMRYIEALTPEKIENLLNHLPELILEFEAQGLPVPQLSDLRI